MGDPRSHFEFADTARQAIKAYLSNDKDAWRYENDYWEKHRAYLDMTVAEFKKFRDAEVTTH